MSFSASKPISRYTAFFFLSCCVWLWRLNYNWMTATPSNLILSSLDKTLEILPFSKRPWGINARTNTSITGIGNIYPSPIAQLQSGSLPSVNMMVKMGHCGAEQVSSSVPLGNSGYVDRTGSFTANTLGRLFSFSLYRFLHWLHVHVFKLGTKWLAFVFLY